MKPKKLELIKTIQNILFANGVKCDSEQFLIEDILGLIPTDKLNQAHWNYPDETETLVISKPVGGGLDKKPSTGKLDWNKIMNKSVSRTARLTNMLNNLRTIEDLDRILTNQKKEILGLECLKEENRNYDDGNQLEIALRNQALEANNYLRLEIKKEIEKL